MKGKLLLYKIIYALFASLIFFQCIREYPNQPQKPCKDNEPVEDTTKVWLYPNSTDTTDIMEICPKAVYALFYPWVSDTNEILGILGKYHLRKVSVFGGVKGQLGALLCVTDNRRAEYHFTPWGKQGFCNFGADSLVEYAFGVFYRSGYNIPNGELVFWFNDGTAQASIDSLFEENGLRFLHTAPDYPAGLIYHTLITPRAKKNVFDLGRELRFVPFVRFCYVGIEYGSEFPFCCD